LSRQAVRPFRLPKQQNRTPVRKSAKNVPPLERNRTAFRQKVFNSHELVFAEDLGIRRDRRFAQLNILPVRYLPSKNVIRVYYSIEFEVKFVDEGLGEARHAPMAKSIGKNIPNAKIYQIVSDRAFENTLAPFIDWKTKKGFDVRVAYTDEIGTTTTDIKSYLQNIYDNEYRADYLLLVGDHEEIPAFTTPFPANNQVIIWAGGERHITDLYFAEYTGDNLPDMFYGRLSAPANDPLQLQNQIDKILAMEKLSVPSDFLAKSMLIAGGETGNEQTILNATVNYAEKYYFNSNNNITASVFRSPGSDALASSMISLIDNGVGFVAYTGHGLPTMWQRNSGSALIGINHVRNFTNADRYPFVISNACLTNRFNTAISFGEAWLRAERSGAVAHIGASNSTFFDEDFQWAVGTVNSMAYPNNITYANSGLGVFDRLFRGPNGDLPHNEWVSTAGEIMFWGNMAVHLSSARYLSSYNPNDMKKYYWEIYHIMGDPSYMPYLFEPQILVAEHFDSISLFATSLTIETIPFAYAGFSKNSELLSAGTADASGRIILELPEELSAGFAKLVITAPNHIPYFSDVLIWADRPIVVVNDYKLSIGSNAVEQPVFGDTLDFEIELKNISSFNTTISHIELQTDNSYVEILRYNALGLPTNLNASDSIWMRTDRLVISPEIPNRHNIRISATIVYSDTLQILRHFNFIAAAPELLVSNFLVIDLQGSLSLTNRGLADLSNAQIQLTSETPEVSVTGFTPATASFATNSAVPFSFNITKTQSAPEFLPYILELSVEKNGFYYITQVSGAFGNLIEDFERGYFHDSIWWSSETYPFEWEIDSVDVYEGKFAMKSGSTLPGSYTSMLTHEFDLIGGDSIVFYYKVSSLKDYDGLEFWVWISNENDDYDYVNLGFFSGEIPWTRAAFEIDEGVQRFEWAYDKYASGSAGQDQAWVDHITFPKMKHTPSIPTSIVVNDPLPDHIAFDVILRNGQLQARINAETPSKATIQLVNVQGQTVATIASNSTINIGQNDFYFDMFNLPRGVYICTFFDGNRVLSRKIIW
jgi:hypothetical protein